MVRRYNDTSGSAGSPGRDQLPPQACAMGSNLNPQTAPMCNSLLCGDMARTL
eukprot:CAMPEP_0178419804 /NCGR_PEP_ID=MMETSP0689_2-20121128/25800_1 /TAXON_ID=160604 /ORGANISM="Amphidinium massartii, Strain CS-259" /LENGTH=51 /DNA_ID=CAMNT_0020041255 /DNA_START=124 /DNA_END=279 /DNA_ORIENTATION=+